MYISKNFEGKGEYPLIHIIYVEAQDSTVRSHTLLLNMMKMITLLLRCLWVVLAWLGFTCFQ